MPTDPTQYVRAIAAEHFDQEMLDLYWQFIAERQRVYARRVVLSQPWPWTADEVMRDEFITNMYRELDPGTRYVVESILGSDEFSTKEDIVFNVMMYRLMGSVPATHEMVHRSVEKFSVDEMVTTLRDRQSDINFKVFGDAYRVAAYHDEGGADKVENVARMFGKIRRQMPEIVRRLEAADGTRAAFEVFKSIPGFGEFLAHQTVVDLLYRSGDRDPILPFGENEWAAAGPGARNGMWTLLAPHIKPRNLLMVMEWLRDHQLDEFARLGITCPYLADDHGDPILLSLCNIQSTLCEFYKYVRIWKGEKEVAVRRYDPTFATAIDPSGYPGVALTSEQLAELADIDPPLTAPRPTEVASEPVEASLPAQQDEVEPEDQGEFLAPQRAVQDPPASTLLTVDTPQGRVEINITINVYRTE